MTTKPKNYYSIVTIYGAGSMNKKFRQKIAKWLRTTADNLIKDGDKYTTGRFTARMMK